MQTQEHIDAIRTVAGKRKIAFVYGNFNILHPGHLRLLKFAKDNGNFLVVGINNRHSSDTLLDADIRLEAVQHSMYVDYALIIESDVLDFIRSLRPDIMVKGSEHKTLSNPEKEVLSEYGGKLIFSSGDIGFSSMQLLRSEFENFDAASIDKPDSFMKRHRIKPLTIRSYLQKFRDLRVVVIGDTIVDEYITCDPIGMSQEDPTIVVTPISSDKFIGGAAIVASHAAGLGAKVRFYSVLGDDLYYGFVEEKLRDYGVECKLFGDTSRPTTLKQRFRAHNKTLLRVNHLKQHHIDIELQDKICREIESAIDETDLIVFSDFSYGCLPQRLIDKITGMGLKKGIMMVADSQSSSQIGDISKFRHMRLVTPTEKEARLALNDFESGLIVLAEKLRKQSDISNVFITLGSEGVLIHADKNKKWVTDQIPALNRSPKDVAGAGDSLLISASMAIAVGASVMEGAYIGSIAAACQVGRVGNIPLNLVELEQEIAE
ncbi:ADP-heptose synthase [Sulfuricurvum sp. IAE1]|uniref:PfkB family carbohydrate kinase n=1 Tax=Sulfuricurvum sp. IAE1 TaxID=2546102 RepID=UPI001046FC46|nr:PfkB family carbohydrate kinase [Sulfuricurvum sp. IAE1]TDA62647.1 ADP-heptose synthase [Sulfuricurvum sp. IAE1]